jgi:hypothetical protein
MFTLVHDPDRYFFYKKNGKEIYEEITTVIEIFASEWYQSLVFLHLAAWTISYITFIIYGKKEDEVKVKYFDEIDNNTTYPRPNFHYPGHPLL